MNVVTADATGLIKVVSLKTNGGLKKMGSQESHRGGITAMSWAGAVNKENEVAIALSEGTIEVWNTVTSEHIDNMQGIPFDGKRDKYIGVHVLRSPVLGEGTQQSIERRLITATQSGKVSIAPWLPYLPDLEEVENEDEELAKKMTKAQIASFKKKRTAERSKQLKEREQAYNSQCAVIDTGKHLERIRVSPSGDIIATGGNENKLKLWDIETQRPLYETRNLKNNWLNMAVPNYDMDFAFFGHYAQENDKVKNVNPNGYLIATTTGQKDVRVYDPRDGTRRPSMHAKVGDHVARSVVVTHDEHYILTGDSAGRIARFDIRGGLRACGVMKGSCGAIRQLAMHPTLNMVASVSLDRHLRVHDVETRNLLKEVYLTQKLTDCLFSEISPGVKARSAQSIKIAKDDDEAHSNTTQKKKMGQSDSTDDLWGRLSTMDKKKTKDEVKEENFMIDDEDDDDNSSEFDEDDYLSMIEEDEDNDLMEYELEVERQNVKKQKEKITNIAKSEPSPVMNDAYDAWGSDIDDSNDSENYNDDMANITNELMNGFGEGENMFGEGEFDPFDGEFEGEGCEGELDHLFDFGEGELDDDDEEIVDNAPISLDSDEDDDNIDDFVFGAEGDEKNILEGEAEGEFDLFNMFGENEGEFDSFGMFEGEGEVDDEDFEFDEDDDLDDMTSSFVILGDDGKAMTSSETFKPLFGDNKKGVIPAKPLPVQKPLPIKSIPPPAHGIKRKLESPIPPQNNKKQRR